MVDLYWDRCWFEETRGLEITLEDDGLLLQVVTSSWIPSIQLLMGMKCLESSTGCCGILCNEPPTLKLAQQVSYLMELPKLWVVCVHCTYVCVCGHVCVPVMALVVFLEEKERSLLWRAQEDGDLVLVCDPDL